jgi:hypothetical protein
MFLDRLTGLNLTEKASDSLRANFHSSYFACDRRQLHFRSHRRKFAHAFIEAALEILRNIRVERIRRLIRRQRAVTPVLVHSEPGAGISPDNRLELVPASLRHFLERRAGGKFNPGMKNHAVTPAGQRLTMDVDEWRARAPGDRAWRQASRAKGPADNKLCATKAERILWRIQVPATPVGSESFSKPCASLQCTHASRSLRPLHRVRALELE